MRVIYFAGVQFEAHKIMSILLRAISFLGTEIQYETLDSWKYYGTVTKLQSLLSSL